MSTRMAYVAIGSNIGDRQWSVRQAVSAIERLPGVWLEQLSPVFETRPVGPAQPRYLNAVVKIQTDVESSTLLNRLLQIELDLGRVRSIKWGPRVIDLDLIYVDGEDFSNGGLTLPHPQLSKRPFVLVPFFHVAPEIVTEINPQLAEGLRQGTSVEGVVEFVSPL